MKNLKRKVNNQLVFWEAIKKDSESVSANHSAWAPPFYPLDHPKIQKWIRQMMCYYRDCYCNPKCGEKKWGASNLKIMEKRDPLKHMEDHAGVHLVRQFYPEFILTKKILKEAKWGK